eukprot:TRINITY_DN4945_c0_g1_i3.p1 TRINITY_DN4945_c0_g1~~TRINITY_DN4945_c0_g1_i3.p1  ORF type:complete len:370 (+),score=78.28 TRINITY_DN4945_c0_g1_i3:90-1112(+)
MALQGGMLCLSGSALGAAVANLLFNDSAFQDASMPNLGRKLKSKRRDRKESEESEFSGSEGDYSPRLPTGTSGTQPVYNSRKDMALEEAGLDWMMGSSNGFSMEDARKRNAEMRQTFKEKTPAEVLSELQRGNARFWTGHANRPAKSAFERRAMIMQQFPVTAVLGCSDSRVPTEVVFDQGLGDMFIVRVAGNCLDTATGASLQYACVHLGVKVLMVMGHEACGAIKAAGLPMEQILKEPEELAGALQILKTGLDEKRLSNITDSRAHDREAVITNVRRQVEALTKDAAIMAKVEAKELMIIGCFYEISSGIVDFFMEVTEASSPPSKGVQSRVEVKGKR